MSKMKEEEVVPYKPFPYRDGNKIVKIYEVEECDELGFKKLLKYCDYTNKKGKLHTGHVLQVTQLGNDNILEQSEIDKFLKSSVDETLPFDWYDGYVLGFVQVEQDLHLMMSWRTEPGRLWEDIYFKVNPEFKSEVLEYYKPFDPSISEEESVRVSDEAGSWDGLMKYVDEGKWFSDIIFIKRTMASYSGVRGAIAKLRLKEDI